MTDSAQTPATKNALSKPAKLVRLLKSVPDVLVTAAEYRFNDGSPVTKQPMDEADIVIGNDVWLAAKVVVLAGAKIGEGSIIGGGAIVRGEIPPFSIAVGAPARVVGQRKTPVA